MLAGPELVLSFGEFLKKIGKKESTIQSYCRDLNQFLSFLNANNASLSSVDQQTLLHYKTESQSKKGAGKSNSFRRAIIAIRQFYRMLPQFSALNLKSLDTIPIPTRDERIPRTLNTEHIETLLQEARKSMKLKSARDRAILALFSFEGIKVSELINLDWKHFIEHQNNGSLIIPGERKRLILLNPKTTDILLEYKKILNDYRTQLPLRCKMILGFRGRDALSIAPKVSRHGLKFMLYELGEFCEIPNLNTETLRHFAMQYHLDQGHSPEDIMKHFGLKRLGNIAKHKTKKDTHGRL